MGVVAEIGYDKFPEQGCHLNKRVEVCFNYDTSRTVKGRMVRDDKGAPYRSIILLDDGRVVLTTECQYSILRE